MPVRFPVMCLIAALAVLPTGHRAEPQAQAAKPPQQTLELTTTQIARRALPAVVTIRAQQPEGEVVGSGFIVDGSGTIITNLHIIKNAKSLSVTTAAGDLYDRVRIRDFDEPRDVAVIQIEAYKLPTIELGDSDLVEPGNPVVLAGSPFGVVQGSISAGIVSGVRQVEAGFRVIQTDAAANPGYSGGPMLNGRGQVIGVLTFRWRGAENLNFVTPINYARPLLDTQGSYDLDELARRFEGPSAVPTSPAAPATPNPPPAPVPRLGSGVEPPVVVKQVNPQYTPEALHAKIQGSVWLECVVVPEGICVDIRVVRSLDPVYGLNEEAVKAAKQWRFIPGKRQNQPVPVLVTIEMTFMLRK